MAKILYDDITFDSNAEVQVYKMLKELKKMHSNLKYEYHPKREVIIKGFTSLSGKRYLNMNYEPDFILTHPTTNKRIILEVKADNDMIFKSVKGGGRRVDNQTAHYAMKYKFIDKHYTDNGDIFLIIRLSKWKNEYESGIFWDKDLDLVKKNHKNGDIEASGKINRAEDKIIEILNEFTIQAPWELGI